MGLTHKKHIDTDCKFMYICVSLILSNKGFKMSNEQSKVVTKVVDLRHKAPDQAIHELMQAAKDGFAVTKIATRFNHTHVYLEASVKQVTESSVVKAQQVSKVEETAPKAATVKKTPTKATTKKTEEGVKDAE